MDDQSKTLAYLIDLEKLEFSEGVDRQKKFLELRMNQKIHDTLLVARHPPTVSLGTRATEEYIRGRLKVSLDSLRSEYRMHVSRDKRGGFETYLGPGQVTFYPIVNMSKLNKRLDLAVNDPNFKPEAKIRLNYMYFLEEAMIQTLKHFGIPAYRRQDHEEATGHRHIGVYVDKYGKTHQIGAAGVLLKLHGGEYYTMFGSSLYILNDDFYELINPCGYEDVLPITMESLLEDAPDYQEVREIAIHKFEEIFQYSFEKKLPDFIQSFNR